MTNRFFFALGNSQGLQGTQFYRARVKSVEELESLVKLHYPKNKVFLKMEREGLSSLYWTIGDKNDSHL
jgi:hypothetical protein